jgi:hypothetical protein
MMLFTSHAVIANTNNQDKVFIKKYVEYAKGYIEKNGLVKSVTDFNNAKRDAKTKGLYIFGFVCGTEKMDGFTLIHPAQPERIYADNSSDPTITKLIAETLASDDDGVWVNYTWYNPMSKQDEPKESYVIYLPEHHLCIGSGFYN